MSPAMASGNDAIYLNTTISPSPALLAGHLWLHAIAALLLISLVLFKVSESWWWLTAGFAMSGAAAGAWFWGRRELQRCWHLQVGPSGWFLAPEGGDFQPVTLTGRLTVWRCLVGLSLRGGDSTIHLLLAPDSMPYEDYRRLRVWLITQVLR